MKKTTFLFLFILLSLFFIGCNNITGNNIIGNTINSNDVINIPLADLSSSVKFYDFNDGGVIIKYFAVLGSDGLPRTAFDACDVCGGYKGYKQVGNNIECNNCGKVFSIDDLGAKNKGYGCWPSYLPHTLEGDNLIIKVTDIKEGRFRFE